MRVLFVAEELDLPEQHVIQHLARQGVSVDVAVSESDRKGSALKEAGIDVSRFRFGHRFDLRCVRFLEDRLRNGNYDIMHCLRNNRPISNGVLAARKSRVKIVVYRGIIGHLHRWDPASRFSYLNSRIDRIVCVCDAVRNYLLSVGVPGRKAVTIYKGHDPKWYTAVKQTDFAAIGIQPDTFLIGCAGAMRPRKGVDVLIRSLDHLPESLPVELMLAGKVADTKLSKLAESPRYRSKVHLLGHRPDAASLMGSCHVFCMPSLRREGLPRAVIEAMAQGVPAVVTNVGGNPEIVEDGISGRVVQPGSPEALAQVFAELASSEDRRKTMGEMARQRIQSHFHIDETLRRTLELYEDVTHH
ncbi:MAG: glycosyltransferase family 4 protein [Kiritimatiellia bacterium]